MALHHTHARLRLAASEGVLVAGYKSGRKSLRDTPDNSSSGNTRSAGTPPRRHLSTACGEIPSAFAKTPRPPEALIARSTGLTSMHCSQPQVEVPVNLRLVVNLNHGFHPLGMSPIGKVILSELKRMDQTQAWLAENAGVSENAVSKWVATGKISRTNVSKVAALLGVSSDQLLNPSESDEMDREWRLLPPTLKARLLAIVRDIRGDKADKEAAEANPRRKARS